MNNKHLYSLNDVIPAPTLPQMTTLSEVLAMPGVNVQQDSNVVASVMAIFTLSKTAKNVFGIDGTPLAPTKLVMLSGANFETAYTKQLDSTLFNEEAQLNHHALMAITSLSDLVEETHRPIRLMSQVFRKKLPTVCKVLNAFYHENRPVIRGISQQLSGS